MPSGLDDAVWIVSAYLIAYIVTMPFMGRLSDTWGRLRTYLASLGLFAVGSIFVPLVDDLPWLIVFRVVQALGGGAMVPVAMAIIGDIFPKGKRGLAMGVLATVDTAGWVFGPLYGAFLVRYLDWRWQFYINIPASLLAAAGAYFVLRRAPRAHRARSLDVSGAAVLAAGLVALNVALSLGGGRAASGPSFNFTGSPPATKAAPILLGVAALLAIVFFAIERRSANPLINLRMFRRPNFAPACLINFLAGIALIIAMVDVPLFVSIVLPEGTEMAYALQTAAARSGQVLAIMTGTMAVASVLGGWLCKRLGYRIPTILGLLLGAAGFALMSTWSVATEFAPMASHLALAGLGFGLVSAPVSATVVDAVGETQRGVASGLVVILRLIGMSVGLSLLTAWGLTRFDQLSSSYSTLQLTSGLVLQLTADVLDEMFLAAGVALLAAAAIAFLLHSRILDPERSA
ncbi:MAG: MFS transporter [Anaerolineales bacterium]|nr:MAG: MFS transporter [Anaerolineales bacterium]